MNYAIVLAAGVGQRMRNGGLPKQFLKLMGKPIVIYTLEKFEECKEIDQIIVVCHGSYVEYM
ncbi:MAG: 2-C-methyl-D-erythritol 4-phosphate cytidylyltransferase, partial [Lachnospiraceae bacterium]|nr:2-C-methyl-D-erythritol 4-phosphate cytidylyltransferase [Lachnospiraceae bacterium]